MSNTCNGINIPDLNGLKPDPAKVKPIVEFTTPKEQVEGARFLAMVKYIARYTENLSQ